jgi:hypothetical protein
MPTNTQYQQLVGARFDSFRGLARAIHETDIRRAKGLEKTRAAREANRKRAAGKARA